MARRIDISDAVRLLGWLFRDNPEPEPICRCLDDCDSDFPRGIVASLVGVSDPQEVRALQDRIIERLRARFRLSGEGVERSDCPDPNDLCDAYVLELWTHEPAIAMAIHTPEVLESLEAMEEVGEISPILFDASP